MSQCQSGSDPYLNHECYSYLNEKFKNIQVGGFSLEYFNNVYSKFEKENERHSSYRTLLLEIISHITKDHIFMNADPRIPCKFVNYLLNYKLRKTDYQYDNISDYHIYKKFLNDFYKEKFGSYDPKKVCVYHIEYITEDIFQRMEILYKLYDQYDGLKKTNEKVDDAACNELSKFYKLFNDTANDHGTKDNELLERLTDLRNLIKVRISSPNYKCNTNINFFRLPETRSTVQEKPDQAPSQENEQQETVALLPKMSQVPNEPEVPEGVPPSRGSERLNTLMESQHPVGLVHLKPLGYEWETENYESGSSHVSGTTHESASYKPESFHRLGGSNMQRPQESHLLMEKEKGNTEAGIYSPGLQISNAAAKEEGVSGILSSITGVLGEVEPGPVLGVSGGMGALFLLFKYTPVGSFFGGRRRRIHQIPSSFRGLSPGEFPIFQEHDVGYIGYGAMNASLAE